MTLAETAKRNFWRSPGKDSAFGSASQDATCSTWQGTKLSLLLEETTDRFHHLAILGSDELPPFNRPDCARSKSPPSLQHLPLDSWETRLAEEDWQNVIMIIGIIGIILIIVIKVITAIIIMIVTIMIIILLLLHASLRNVQHAHCIEASLNFCVHQTLLDLRIPGY